jgi:hypothetical protein
MFVSEITGSAEKHQCIGIRLVEGGTCFCHLLTVPPSREGKRS